MVDEDTDDVSITIHYPSQGQPGHLAAGPVSKVR